ALRTHGPRAALLALTLLLPATHYVYFKLNWHAGQYQPGGPTLAQAKRLARGLVGAESLEYVGAGLALAALAGGVRRPPAGGGGGRGCGPRAGGRGGGGRCGGRGAPPCPCRWTPCPAGTRCRRSGAWT